MSSSQPHKRVTLGDIIYSINEADKTSSVTRYIGKATEIIIPRSIKHESKEYIVSIITSRAFADSKVRSVSFEPNSKLRTIGAYAFSWSALATIQIPSHVTQICEGAFSCCDQLSRVSFEPNSELRTIGKEAFSDSALARIQIPSHVTQICEGAFSYCYQLSRFEFEPNSELRTIGKDAFLDSGLARIQIPAGAVELEDGWCSGTEHLIDVEVDRENGRYSSVGGKLVIGKSDIANENYDTLVFCARDTIEANIPATIKIICAHASSYSALARIQIPSHVTQICERAFYCCKRLSQVEFEPNSELRTIGKEAFYNSALARIQIPSHVTQICERAFYFCERLSRVEFEPNSELRTIGKDAFSYSALASIQIPSHITTLENAFLLCNQLQIVEIDEKSMEESIVKRTFCSSKIVMLPAREKHF